MGANNTILRKRIQERERELSKLWVVGDTTVSWQLVDEFAGEFTDSVSRQSIYQMIRYYLRDGSSSGEDNRKAYTLLELQNLVAMSPADRLAYARETGRTTRAVNAALERYRAKQNRDSADESVATIKFTESRLEKQGFFNISLPSDLKAMGLGRADIISARNILSAKFGLALRVPNILYHPLTKRRYSMITSEQVALIRNPVRFLKDRSAHIKNSWVLSDRDPMADYEVEALVGARGTSYQQKDAYYPLTDDGVVDLTVKSTRLAGILNAATFLTKALTRFNTINPSNTAYKHLSGLKQLLDMVLTTESHQEMIIDGSVEEMGKVEEMVGLNVDIFEPFEEAQP